jgi:hypothetical protein
MGLPASLHTEEINMKISFSFTVFIFKKKNSDH